MPHTSLWVYACCLSKEVAVQCQQGVNDWKPQKETKGSADSADEGVQVNQGHLGADRHLHGGKPQENVSHLLLSWWGRRHKVKPVLVSAIGLDLVLVAYTRPLHICKRAYVLVKINLTFYLQFFPQWPYTHPSMGQKWRLQPSCFLLRWVPPLHHKDSAQGHSPKVLATLGLFFSKGWYTASRWGAWHQTPFWSSLKWSTVKWEGLGS